MAKKKQKKTKKKAVGKKAPRTAGGSAPRGTLARQLVAVNQDLNEIYDAEHQWRLELLKANEELSRQTVDTEVEIRRFQQQQTQAQKELTTLLREREAANSAASDLTRKVDSAQREFDKIVAKRDDLDQTVKKLTRENANFKKEAEKLAKERQRLQTDVDRLKRLSREYRDEVAKFRREKSKLLDD